MGCVLPAGLKTNLPVKAMLKAGLPAATGATTINKLCGSGMKATMFAHDLLVAGSVDIAVAGWYGVYDQCTYVLTKLVVVIVWVMVTSNHMFLDGLEDAETGRLMGSLLKEMATKLELTVNKWTILRLPL